MRGRDGGTHDFNTCTCQPPCARTHTHTMIITIIIMTEVHKRMFAY